MIQGYHQERYQEEWTDGRQHSRPQGLEIGSFQGDPLTWKSLQGEKKVRKYELVIYITNCKICDFITDSAESKK